MDIYRWLKCLIWRSLILHSWRVKEMCDRFQKLKEENWINQENFALILTRDCTLGDTMNHSSLLKTSKNSISKGVMFEAFLSMKLINLFVQFVLTGTRTLFKSLTEANNKSPSKWRILLMTKGFCRLYLSNTLTLKPYHLFSSETVWMWHFTTSKTTKLNGSLKGKNVQEITFQYPTSMMKSRTRSMWTYWKGMSRKHLFLHLQSNQLQNF